MAVCSSCIIDYHTSHIQEAKTKIEDFISTQKKEIDSLKPLIFSASKKNEIIDSIRKHIEIQNNEFTQYLEKRTNEIEEMKNSLDKILILERRSIQEFKDKTESAYSEMYNDKLFGLLEKSNIVSSDIFKLIEKWDQISNQDKMDIIKKNQIANLKQEATFKKNNLALEVDIIQGNIINLISYIKNDRKEISKNTMIDGIEIEINNIFTTLKNNFDNLQKNDILKIAKNFNSKQPNNNIFESQFNNNKKIFETNGKNEENSFFKIFNENNRSPNNNFTKDGDEKKVKKDDNSKAPFRNDQITLGIDVPPSHRFFQASISNFTVDLLKENDINNTAFAVADGNYLSYEFVIGIKPGFKTIKVFDSKAFKLFNYELSRLMFQDQSLLLDDFLNNCRYINLGFSILITGGLINSSPVNNSYLLIVTRVPNSLIGTENSLQISLLPYTFMNDARERHLLLNIPDKNKILACSGFQKKSVEISNVKSGIWQSLDSLKEIRANATGAYINNRYVYIFGGFQLDNGKGVYNNSTEVLDLNNDRSLWRFIDFESLFPNNIKISAAGILHYSSNKILVCGGYNGQVYLKDIYCIENKQSQIEIYEKTKLQLADELIFFHSTFLRCGGSAVNFDYKLDLNVYNPVTKEFKIYK